MFSIKEIVIPSIQIRDKRSSFKRNPKNLDRNLKTFTLFSPPDFVRLLLVEGMLPFRCCSIRYLIDVSFPMATSCSASSTFNEVFDVLNCSIILSGVIIDFIPWISSSSDVSLLLSKNDEDVVVVLEDAPVNLSKWSSSDDKSRLFAKGTEWESTGAETLTSS